ncbi:MAG TPA: Dabb family protein [Candidatus Saccharimonadales bacterium]|nr:Dabb family protein [Candidatus Saccharimonadales bacterium]
MKIRHTVIFTFYESTTEEQKQEVIARLNDMGRWLTEKLGVTDWTVAEHIPETFKQGRAHLLQDGIFPSLEAMEQHAQSAAHKRVVELTPNVCDWMTVDTVVEEA